MARFSYRKVACREECVCHTSAEEYMIRRFKQSLDDRGLISYFYASNDKDKGVPWILSYRLDVPLFFFKLHSRKRR